jgi:asparagine synthase (glutamine-hydrolysing)
MCGIVGFFGVRVDTEQKINLLSNMNDSIRHRGPDDEGVYVDDRVGLAMRRLSIIDVKGGHQPISNEKGTRTIVFNGEIYNYRELRANLVHQGHPFRTNTDTEVILRQYEQDGLKCVSSLNGMFAFAIWDREAGKLTLARDRMGVKPLYYYWDGSSLIFSSEIKAILASGLVEKEVNPQAIWDYLTFRYVPQPETVWKKIHKLPPGHTLSISIEQPVPILHRYWDIPVGGGNSSVSKKHNYLDEFEALFLDSVRQHLIAEVPVGILLSGGLDSSAVAAAAAEVHGGKLATFSVGFENSPVTDELPYARKVAKALGVEHNEIVIGQREFMEFLPKCLHYLDEPLADLASIPLYYVSSLAKEKVKVVLSGEGSDEILGGYGFDRSMRYWDMVRSMQAMPTWFHRLVLHPLGKVDPRLRRLADFAGSSFASRFEADPPNMTNYLSTIQKTAFFPASIGMRDSMDPLRTYLRGASSSDPLSLSLNLLCQSWLVEDLLMKADKMTMANSIELRVPFLDYRLVEWAAQVPSNVKVCKVGRGKYEGKYVLRQFARTRLPAEIIDRPKQGFPVPVYEWLGGTLKSWMEERLFDRSNWINNFFEASALEREVRQWQREGLVGQHKIWNLLVLQIWADQWI